MKLPRFLEMNPPSHKTIDWLGPLMLFVAGCVFFYFRLRSHYSIDWSLAGQALAVAIPLAIVAYALWAAYVTRDRGTHPTIQPSVPWPRTTALTATQLDEPTVGECDADDPCPESVSEFIRRRNGNNPWRDREFDNE